MPAVACGSLSWSYQWLSLASQTKSTYDDHLRLIGKREVDLVDLLFFQLILQTLYIPSGFKSSYIVPIPKPKDSHSKALKCDHFRGIAISPIISKIFEHCLLEKYQSYFESSTNQFGFKKGLGCRNAIYTVRNIVSDYVSKGSTVNLCTIDLSKAFDKINHNALYKNDETFYSTPIIYI